MVIFHCYISSPEGILTSLGWIHIIPWWTIPWASSHLGMKNIVPFTEPYIHHLTDDVPTKTTTKASIDSWAYHEFSHIFSWLSTMKSLFRSAPALVSVLQKAWYAFAEASRHGANKERRTGTLADGQMFPKLMEVYPPVNLQKNYGKSPLKQWVNQLVLWPCLIAKC